ncbi:MAG TPA: hypothetical protein VFQ44_16215 [Streptosporangiaceae bacterium]|nr:hypothetical protein [Streptosporangiaceae bacterium]
MTELQDAWFEPDSEGCLVVVGSYSYRADLVRDVVDRVSRRILASPALSDFIAMKFVDLGAVPDPGVSPGDAVTRLAGELALQGGFAARNYFALVVADRSAMAARELLLACQDNDFISELPVSFLGIANVDDRGLAEKDADTRSSIEIASAPGSAWHVPELVTELHHYAERLMSEFAAPGQKGITVGQFDELRPQDVGEAVAALPAQPSSPDALGDSPGRCRESAEDGPADYRPDRRPGPPERDPGPAPGHGRWRSPGRGLTVLRSGNGRGWPDENPVSSKPEPLPVKAVYLVLCSSEVTGERADWRRGKSVLLALDEKLAAAPQVACQVKAAQVAADLTRDSLRPAGQMSRRSLKRHFERTDLSRVLTGIDQSVTRDLAGFQRAGFNVTRPAVVIFAADAPLADLATVEAYEKLTSQADITWVAPEAVLTLLSPRFSQLSGADPIVDHEAVADEVIAALLPCSPGRPIG